ncbi:pseudouridine synthase [Brevundimonas vancanneytii]|uniref:Pseudouridine synthase n=1 Tax=Brevundimonas vancanneytii TaxID=1325724 RepID=A0A4P1K254_9CAUL|nr:pseudouridine synthase [Brevundimonas vancanneytii]VTO14450.1 Ribosomal large subunit pseudouridine synthase B [Brevundimonas vancanneytii]
MDRHPKDNDKKPRSRQDDGARGPRNFADKGPRKPFDKDGKPGGKPRDRVGGKPGDKSASEAKGPERTERIAKAMARAGIASRREVERLIGLGKVAVNGRILATPAVLVTRDDKITVDGKPIGAAQATRVWRYHKPAGLITSHNDPAGRPTVFDALPSGLPRVISVGRLDLATEGLLLLTNDGELSRALELPETALVRQYRARARGRITQEQLDKLKDGVVVDGVRYGPVEATIDKAKEKAEGEKSSANLWLSVSITEGKNREVRKVLESIGLTVNRLIRLAYGPFQLGTLPVGSVEEVGPRVIREMLAEHIRPENLPTGNTVATPAPIPGRRTGTPIVRGKSGSAMSDPSRKPSRVRAAETAAEDGAEFGKPARKEGWPRPSRSSNTRRPSSRAPVQAMTKGRKAAIVRAVRSRRANRAPTSSSTTVAVRPRAAVPAESPGGKPFGRPGGAGGRPDARSDSRSGDRPGGPRGGGKPFGGKPFGGKPSGGAGGRGGPRGRG